MESILKSNSPLLHSTTSIAPQTPNLNTDNSQIRIRAIVLPSATHNTPLQFTLPTKSINSNFTLTTLDYVNCTANT